MKIRKVMFGYLEFDNGMTINSFTSYDDEYANNYADFTQLLDTVAMDIDFDTDLVFVKNHFGFSFGNKRHSKFFVPCYTIQNGYYTDTTDIYFNHKKVLVVDCEDKEDI